MSYRIYGTHANKFNNDKGGMRHAKKFNYDRVGMPKSQTMLKAVGTTKRHAVCCRICRCIQYDDLHGPFDKFVDSDTSLLGMMSKLRCHCKVCLVLGWYTKFHTFLLLAFDSQLSIDDEFDRLFIMDNSEVRANDYFSFF
jgi:hypothetical protein